MSELKATPGPWIEGVDGNLRIYGPDGMGEHSGLIAQVYKGRGNLKLMLAAPEMYQELSDLAADYYCECGHPRCRIEETRRSIDALLAKARGENQ